MKLIRLLLLFFSVNSFCQNYSAAVIDATVVEGDTVQMTLTISEPQEVDIWVPLVLAVSSIQNNDHNLSSDFVFIPAGQTSGFFDVSTTEDNLGEPTKDLYICPYVTNYTCGKLSVLDDDPNIVGEIVTGDDILSVGQNFVVLFYNVISNDTINGIPATFDSVTLSLISAPQGMWIQENGSIAAQGNEPPGVYTIIYQLCAISDPSNCEIGTVTLTINNSMNLENFELDYLKFTPNPVQNILTISNLSPIEQVSIQSIFGQTLLEKKYSDAEAQIDFSDFSAGVYYVKINSAHQSKTVKIIKN